jgi:hypothetical protein
MDSVKTLHEFFRAAPHYSKTAGKIPDFLDDFQEELDVFIIEIAHFFAAAFKTAFFHVSYRNVTLKSPRVKEYFVTGFESVTSGREEICLRTQLETLSAAVIKEETVSVSEILQLKLLENIIPMIQRHDVKGFIIFAAQFCSRQLASDVFLILHPTKIP